MEIGLLSCCEMQLYFRFLRASEALLSFLGVNVIWRDETRGDKRIVSNGIHFIDPRGRSCFVSAAAQETEVKRLEPRVKTHIGYFFSFLFFARKHHPFCWQNQIVFMPTLGPLHISGCHFGSHPKKCVCVSQTERRWVIIVCLWIGMVRKQKKFCFEYKTNYLPFMHLDQAWADYGHMWLIRLLIQPTKLEEMMLTVKKQ